VGQSHQAARDGDAKGESDEAAHCDRTIEALLALFSIDKVVVGGVTELALGAGESIFTIPISARSGLVPTSAALPAG